MRTLGQRLVEALEARGVDTVFGIPGVHTIELYRGLAGSGIHHVTPRHEQGAGFMADGYARASGRPGVAFVISGPGATNILTPMAQALADSVPMLVVASSPPEATLGRGLGALHELPDQFGVMSLATRCVIRLTDPDDIGPSLDKIFSAFATQRPGPAYLEVPMDLLGHIAAELPAPASAHEPPIADHQALSEAALRLQNAKRPLILAGGGVRRASEPLRRVAEILDAPVVLTTNARGLLHTHPLAIPASPSLSAVRRLMASADVVLAVGTELGATDFDVYADGQTPDLKGLIRINLAAQPIISKAAEVDIRADAHMALTELGELLSPRPGTGGAARAGEVRAAAREEIGPDMRAQVDWIETLREEIPDALLIGDSTQPIYAANLCYDHDRPGGFFNAATGYGALGYGIPAAIGAALACPSQAVVCVTGDGGAQFSLAELSVAAELNLRIVFVVWNNGGYREIAEALDAAGTEVIGCTPRPPKFEGVAEACGLAFVRSLPGTAELRTALAKLPATGPVLLEVQV